MRHYIAEMKRRLMDPEPEFTPPPRLRATTDMYAEPGNADAVRATIALIWGRKWLILGVAAVAVAGMAVWTYRQPKTYLANTALIVDQRMPRVLAGNVTEVVDISPHAYRDTEAYMKTQVTVACSTQVARLAASRLNLHRDASFWPAKARIPANGRTAELAGGWLASMVRCSARKDASIIDIAVEHTNPRLAARLSSAMAQAYMDHNLDRKLSSAHGAVKWLAERLGDLKQELDQAESKLFDYRKEHGLVSLTLADRQTLLSQRLTDLTRQLNHVRAERIGMMAQAEQLKGLSLADPLAVPEMPVLQTEVIRRLKLRVLEEQTKLQEESGRYLPKHPRVAAQKSKRDQAVADLTKQIRAVVAGTTESLQQVRAKEKMLLKALESTKAEAFATNEREMAYRRLARNAKSAENLYGMVLGRMTESDLTTKLRANNVRMLEPARVPGAPIRPRPKVRLLMALLLGLFLGVGLVFGLEALDNSVVGQEEVEAEGLVFLGSLPLFEGVGAGEPTDRAAQGQVRELVAQQRPRSAGAEDCRAIRTNLLFASPDRPLRKLLITSSGPGEGKTLTATNLAITMAQRGTRVLLIDADMRRPSLQDVFGVPLSDGLTVALTEDSDPLVHAKCTETKNLWVMTAGTLPPNPAELCHSERLGQVLDTLADAYDLVILDSPPVMPVTDPVVLSTRCDGVLLLARSGSTSKDALQQSARRLLDVGAPVLGCVVNGVDERNVRYRYRYSSARARGHAYAYGAATEGPPSGRGDGGSPTRRS